MATGAYVHCCLSPRCLCRSTYSPLLLFHFIIFLPSPFNFAQVSASPCWQPSRPHQGCSLSLSSSAASGSTPFAASGSTPFVVLSAHFSFSRLWQHSIRCFWQHSIRCALCTFLFRCLWQHFNSRQLLCSFRVVDVVPGWAGEDTNGDSNKDLRLATWIQHVNGKPSSSCKSHILKSLTRGGGQPPSPPV